MTTALQNLRSNGIDNISQLFGTGFSPRIMLSNPTRSWYPEVIRRLNELAALSRGWDGYDGQPVSFDTACFALQMLEKTCSQDAPAPQIVPGSSGDLQIEWHMDTGDIELHVRKPYDVVGYYVSSRLGASNEDLILTNDFTEVAKWLKAVTEPMLAYTATA